MFARFISIIRPVRKVGSSYQLHWRGGSGWSRYTRRKYRVPLASVAGAIGTVAVYRLTAQDPPRVDSGDWKSNISSMLRPTSAKCQAQLEDSEVHENARNVLKYCGVNEEEISRIIQDMQLYLENSQKATENENYVINDAIHGPIVLSPLQFQIINTREFHRLKDLRQLGGAHYVYPGANHTRFEHSIGVSYVAGKFAHSLKQQLEKDRYKDSEIKEEHRDMYKFDDKEVVCAEIAGLCHDLGHGPLSHMFEKVMNQVLKIDVEHEDLSIAIFKRILKNPKVLGEFVRAKLTESHVQLIANMIHPPKSLDDREERLFLYEIVANKETGIDVDKWDYYSRDCHYLGILQDFQRTMLLGRVVMTPEGYEGKDRLRIGFRNKEMENIYGMFRTRANIHHKACQHKTIKAVEKMFMDALELVQDLELVWVPSLSEKELADGKGSFKSIRKAAELAMKDTNLDWYLAMTDSIMGSIMSADAHTESEKKKLAQAKMLLRRVEERDIYACLVRKRVPKFSHIVEYLKSDHHAYDACKLCSKELTKDMELKAVERLYDDHEKRKEFEASIYESLSTQDKSIIGQKNIWVEIVKIKHSSEKEVNPVKEVLFFEKPKTHRELPTVLQKDTTQKMVSMVVVPQAFVEYELRVYDKRPKTKRKEHHQEALEDAMEKALKKIVAKHQDSN